ncbi:hypothetical protein GCM10009078_35690 [Cupriavidus gilardii]
MYTLLKSCSTEAAGGAVQAAAGANTTGTNIMSLLSRKPYLVALAVMAAAAAVSIVASVIQ